MNDNSQKGMSSRAYAVSVMMAMITSTPGILAFLITWNVTDDILNALIISVFVYIVAVGFGIKFAKRMLKRLY